MIWFPIPSTFYRNFVSELTITFYRSVKVPYNQTTLLKHYYDPNSPNRPNSMAPLAAPAGTQKIDLANALKTDWWIDGDKSVPPPWNTTNHTFLQQLAPLSNSLVSRAEQYFAANYSTYETSLLYKNSEYFANPIFINDQMKFLQILTDVLNETDILGNLDAGSFVGADIPKTDLQMRAEKMKVHFENFDEFLVGQYCFEWKVEQELLAQNSMGAAYQEMMNPDVRFEILQTMFENDTYTYNYPEKPPCGKGQIVEVYAVEQESTSYWDEWQIGKWQGLFLTEDGQLKNTNVKKKDQVLALSGYRSSIHRFNITRHLSYYPYTAERGSEFRSGALLDVQKEQEIRSQEELRAIGALPPAGAMVGATFGVDEDGEMTGVNTLDVDEFGDASSLITF
jgi:hypothetical protein